MEVCGRSGKATAWKKVTRWVKHVSWRLPKQWFAPMLGYTDHTKDGILGNPALSPIQKAVLMSAGVFNILQVTTAWALAFKAMALDPSTIIGVFGGDALHLSLLPSFALFNHKLQSMRFQLCSSTG